MNATPTATRPTSTPEGFRGQSNGRVFRKKDQPSEHRILWFGDNSKADDWMWEHRIKPQILKGIQRTIESSYANYQEGSWHNLNDAGHEPQAEVYYVPGSELNAVKRLLRKDKKMRCPELTWHEVPQKVGAGGPIASYIAEPGWSAFIVPAWYYHADLRRFISAGGPNILQQVLDDHDRTRRINACRGVRVRDEKELEREWEVVGDVQDSPEDVLQAAEELDEDLHTYARTWWSWDGTPIVGFNVYAPPDSEDYFDILKRLRVYPKTAKERVRVG